MTIFQPVLKGELLNDQADSSATEEYFDRLEVLEYELGKREPPQIFPQYKGTGNNSLVHSFHRDVLWALVQTFFGKLKDLLFGTAQNMVQAFLPVAREKRTTD